MRKQDKDHKKRFFRSSDRFVRQNGEWYYCTREGQMGPFGDEMTARRHLKHYVGAQDDLVEFQKKREAARIKREQLMKPRSVAPDGLFAFDTFAD